MKKQDYTENMTLAFRVAAGGIMVALLLALGGCGSESKQDSPKGAAQGKAVGEKAKGTTQVREITPDVPATGKIKEVTPGKDGAKSSLPASQLLDEEVFPPAIPGQKGITLQDLEKAKALQSQKLPPDTVVFPPIVPGGKGITLQDLEDAKKQQPEIDLDQEVFPPINPGEKGLTFRDLERLKATQAPPPLPNEALPSPARPKAREIR